MSSSSSNEDDAERLDRTEKLYGFLNRFYPRRVSPQFPRSANNATFPHALEENMMVGYERCPDADPRRPLTTLREFTMMRLMDSITDKLSWEDKVFNDKITAKWGEEILANEDLDVSEEMMDYIIEELKVKAKLFKGTGAVTSYDGDIVKSDTAVPESLKFALRAAASTLENDERICATALYYYDSTNITSSPLAFRCVCDPGPVERAEIYYVQHKHSWLEHIFGFENGDPNVQDVGSIDCRDGRLLTFPNIFQHQVQPFGLADPTKPGHRKILAFFLIDPTHRVLSTANVPAQRLDWFERQMDVSREVLGRLPVELKMMVYEEIGDFPISIEGAKMFREELMERRREYVAQSNTDWAAHVFSLCEH